MLGMRVWPLRACLGFFVTMLAAAALFSATAALIEGVYSSELVYTGRDEGVITIGWSGAKTLATGTVPLYLVEILKAMPGVEAVSPEAAAVCLLDGREPVMARGVLPREFLSTARIRVSEGEYFSEDMPHSALVGRRLAKRAGISVGDEILLVSALSDRSVTLRVVGIFESGTPLEDELLTPLWVGQWLRGLPYSRVSFVRVVMAEGYGPEDLREALLSNHTLRLTLVHSANQTRAVGVRVRLVDPLGRLVAEGATDEQGRVSFTVQPGLYLIYPVVGGKTSEKPFEVLVTSEAEFTVELPQRLTAELKPTTRKAPTESRALPKEYVELVRPFVDLSKIEVGSEGSLGELLSKTIGIPKKALWTLAGVVSLSTLLTIRQSASTLMSDLRRVLDILRAIGASRSYLRVRLLLMGGALSAASGALGCLLGVGVLRLIVERGTVYVALHSLEVEITPALMASSTALAALLGSATVLMESKRALTDMEHFEHALSAG